MHRFRPRRVLRGVFSFCYGDVCFWSGGGFSLHWFWCVLFYVLGFRLWTLFLVVGLVIRVIVWV